MSTSLYDRSVPTFLLVKTVEEYAKFAESQRQEGG
jgi:hypothetical protein